MMRWRPALGQLPWHLVAVTIGFTFLLPLLWMLSTALKAPGAVFETPIQWIPDNPRWDNYAQVFLKLPLFARFFVNTFYVSIMGTLGSVVSSLVVAFGLARINWPGRKLVFGLLVATLMLPGVVTIIPLFIIYKTINLVGTFYPLWLPAWFGFAFYIFLMRQYMLTLPLELDEAAKMDGASHFRILWQVIAPLCGPALAAIAIFSFLLHYNDFLGPLLYVTSNEMFTLQLGLLWFQGRFGNFWHLVMAASVMTIAPVLVLFFIAQKHFVEGIQLTGLSGR